MTPLEELLATLQTNQGDKDAARKLGIAVMGLNLMGARKGQEWGAVGNAGLNGLGAYQGALGAAQQGKLDSLKTRSDAMNLLAQQQQYDDSQTARDVEQNYRPPQASMPTLPNMAPTPENAAALSQMPAAKQPGQYEYYMGLANAYKEKGLIKQAMQIEQQAAKYAPQPKELKDQKTLMQNGKRVTVNIYKDGSHEILPFDPDMEKAHFADTGGKILALDPMTGLPRGQGIGKEQTPDSQASNGLGWARFNYEKAKDAKGGEQKPQLVNGQWVYPPSAQSPTGRAVTPEGLQAPDKPLTESQAKATAFANQMADASRTIAALAASGFDGKSKVQQAAIVSAGADGVPYVPGSAAIPRAMAGKDAQTFQQAELQWTEGALRFMTGANAPEAEVRRNAATYFPRPGDSDAVIQRKAEARKNMEESVRLAAGGGNKQLPGMPESSAQAGASAANGLTPAEAAELAALRKKLNR